MSLHSRRPFGSDSGTSCLMTEAPERVEDKQLQELGIEVAEETEE